MATAPSTYPRVRWLLAATPVMVALAHDAAVLPHEFSHSVVVWLVGIKDQPGNIYDDVPMQVFSDDGDVHNCIQDTGTNSWVIYVVGSYLVPWGSWTSSGTCCRLGCNSAISSRQPLAA